MNVPMNVMSVKNSNKEERKTHTKTLFDENNDVVLLVFGEDGDGIK
jgi:hypothetical protein